MTDTERPNLSRRRMLTAATFLPAAAVGVLGAQTAAQAAYNRSMRRSHVIRRAEDWYDRRIAYDQSGRAWDLDREHLYRRDCSGFVSNCWHSSAPGHSTRTLPEIAPKIKFSQLKAGDIVNSYDNHCMLFHKWADKAAGIIWTFDLVSPSVGMRHARHHISTLRAQNYWARRYTKIIDG